MSLSIENLSKENIEDVILLHAKNKWVSIPKNVWNVHLRVYSRFCFVAKKENAVVGYILALNQRYFDISLFVDISHRRQGIAKKLLLKCVSSVYKTNNQDIVVSAKILVSNPAVNLFKMFGFVVNLQENDTYLLLRQRHAKIDIPKDFFIEN